MIHSLLKVGYRACHNLNEYKSALLHYLSHTVDSKVELTIEDSTMYADFLGAKVRVADRIRSREEIEAALHQGNIELNPGPEFKNFRRRS